jgi:hypothetical protein
VGPNQVIRLDDDTVLAYSPTLVLRLSSDLRSPSRLMGSRVFLVNSSTVSNLQRDPHNHGRRDPQAIADAILVELKRMIEEGSGGGE